MSWIFFTYVLLLKDFSIIIIKTTSRNKMEKIRTTFATITSCIMLIVIAFFTTLTIYCLNYDWEVAYNNTMNNIAKNSKPLDIDDIL